MATQRVTRSRATATSETLPATAIATAPSPVKSKSKAAATPSKKGTSKSESSTSTSTSTSTQSPTSSSSTSTSSSSTTKRKRADVDNATIATHRSTNTSITPVPVTEPVAGLQNLPTAEPVPETKTRQRGRAPSTSTSTTSSSLPVNPSLLYDAIVLDIEGTTTPITFVHQTLFPYAKNHLEEYLENTWNTPQTKKDVQALITQAEADVAAGVPGVVPIDPLPTSRKKAKSEEKEDIDTIMSHIRSQVIANVRWQIAADRKITALKVLQGHMWQVGYDKGELIGEFYDDVIPQIKAWTHAGAKVYIYSSGSIEAQKLIFGHTPEGSLLSHLSGYFDTTTGPKQETSSYTKIANAIGAEPKRILFLTDIHGEAVAADRAGMAVKLLLRPGNSPLPSSHTFNTTPDFYFSIQKI